MQRDSQVDFFRLESSTPSTLPRESSTQLGTIQVDSLLVSAQPATILRAGSLFVFQLTFNRKTSSDGTTTMESVSPQNLELQAFLVSCPYVALHLSSAAQLLLAATAAGKIQVLNLDTMVSHLSPTRNKKPFKSIPKMDPRPIPTLLETPQSFRKTLGLDFLPDSKQLGVATSFSAVYIFDLVTQKLAPWSEGQGFPLKTLPNELANRKESPLRLSMNPSDPTKLMMVRTIYFIGIYISHARNLLPARAISCWLVIHAI
jgi:hypothetical protein